MASASAASLRDQMLTRIRNKAVFHLTREHVVEGLKLVPDGVYSFVHGDSESILDVYADFADRIAGAFATGSAVSGVPGTPISALLASVSDLTRDLLVALDTVVAEGLNPLGLLVEDLPPDA